VELRNKTQGNGISDQQHLKLSSSPGAVAPFACSSSTSGLGVQWRLVQICRERVWIQFHSHC